MNWRRHVAADRDRAARLAALALGRDRREPLRAEIAHARAGRAQRVDEVADRPLAHPGHAVEAMFPAAQREDRGQRAERGAGVAEVERRAAHREAATRAVHDRTTRCAIATDAHAQRRERVEHAVGVVGLEQALHAGAALRQRGEQQHAVADALGTRQRHRAVRVRGRRQDEVGRRHRYSASGTAGRAEGDSACQRRRASDARANRRASSSPSPASIAARMRPSIDA